jgi:hypothetical protein
MLPLKKRAITTFISIALLTVVGFFGAAGLAAAQVDGEPGTPGYTGPNLEIPVPGLEFSGIVRDNGYITIPWLGQYIGGVYAFLISIVGMFAAVVIVIGGFQYVTSAGDKGKIGAAKKRITNAMIGLLLVFGSYTILYVINPALTKFEGLQIVGVTPDFLEPVDPEVSPEVTPETAEFTDEATPPEAPPPPAGGLYEFVSISRKKDAQCTMSHDMKVAKHVKPAIVAAAAKLYEDTKTMFGGPYKFRGGGFRELGQRGDKGSSQVGKWEVNCGYGGKCGNVCNPFGSRENWTSGKPPKPTYCSHTSGYAVDVYCESKTYKLKTGQMVTTSDKTIYVPCQLKFEEIMKNQGFCRLMHEIWHYEFPKFTGGCSVGGWTGMWAKNKTKKMGGGKFQMAYRDCDGIFAYGDNGYSGKCLGPVDTTYTPTNPVKGGTPACK